MEKRIYQIKVVDVNQTKKEEIIMPNFCECGADTYICQKCGRILCSKDYPSTWRPDITEHESAGNVCPSCLRGGVKEKEEGLISLYEHCQRESGLSDPTSVLQYMNRYYGHC